MGALLLVSDVRRDAAYERSGGTESVVSSRVPAQPEPEWKVVHERLVSFVKRRAGLEWEEGRLLCDAQRAHVHRRLGFASFSEYVERLFGYNGRLVKEKLRVAQALESLPQASEALRSGELSWSAVRELSRVATAETERAWLDSARGLTVRQVEEAVSGRAPGDLPSDPADSRLRTYQFRMELTAEAQALLLDALAALRREAGEALDDSAAVVLMARRVLSSREGGDTDGGRSSYQVQVNTCKRCRQAEQMGGGVAHLIAPAIAEMAWCDAQVLPEANETPVGQRGTRTTDASETRVGQRATQTIAPALRRQVTRRDNGRCVVSGCRHATWIDVHHLKPRSELGQNEADNLACLCSAHHRAVHEGRLIIEGRPSTGLTFKHADGTDYGGAVHAEVASRNAQVFAALRTMGFKERDCREVLERCSASLAATTSREEMLRTALGVLTP